MSLLQPQDRKSRDAGDSREAVQARRGLLESGIGTALIEAVVSHVAALHAGKREPVVVELGSGTGDTLGMLAAARSINGVGIDLSAAAAALSAKRFPTVTWVVANADRRLPLLDASVDLVLSVHARRNPEECARVLGSSGYLVVAVPGPDDLLELRETVQGEGVLRDRVPALIAEHERWFSPSGRFAVSRSLHLDAPALRNLLRGTYRGERLSASPRVQGLDRLRVTLSSDVVVFTPRAAR